MDMYLRENFGYVEAKNSSVELLQRWRSACWLVKNRKRRFRYTANLSKRSEADAIRRAFKSIQTVRSVKIVPAKPKEPEKKPEKPKEPLKEPEKMIWTLLSPWSATLSCFPLFELFRPQEAPLKEPEKPKEPENKPEKPKEQEVRENPSASSSEPVHDVSPHGSSRRRITSWQKGALLGRGSFGSVYKGFDNHNKSVFAVNEVSLFDPGNRGDKRLSRLQQEISLLSQFDHENIVRYLGSDKDDTNLYVFLELMTEGSLKNLYDKCDLTESQVSTYTRQILNGLKYLHDQKVVHRDIKCANILAGASESVKLADFGLAKAIEMNSAKTCVGSFYWMAPEVANPKRRSSQLNGSYGLEADIWSIGCTVLEMLTREHPYPGLEPQALFKSAHGEPPQVPESLSIEARDFIRRCLQVNPDDRPSAAQLLGDPFVRKPSTSGFA